MQQRFINFMSISLLVVMVAQAAQTSMVATKFNTEADIPTSITRTCMRNGFAVGFAQQVATLGIGVACSGSRESADNAALGVFIQWPACVIASLMAYAITSDNIRILTKIDKASSDLVHDKIMGHSNIDSRYRFLDMQYKQLRFGTAVFERVCESATIYTTYNTMLEEYVKRREFLKGYVGASLLGPLPPIAALYILIISGMVS